MAGAALLRCVAWLHERLLARSRGERTGAWVVPVVLVGGVLGGLFVAALVRQL